jgi:hypothetical protein
MTDACRRMPTTSDAGRFAAPPIPMAPTWIDLVACQTVTASRSVSTITHADQCGRP